MQVKIERFECNYRDYSQEQAYLKADERQGDGWNASLWNGHDCND